MKIIYLNKCSHFSRAKQAIANSSQIMRRRTIGNYIKFSLKFYSGFSCIFIFSSSYMVVGLVGWMGDSLADEKRGKYLKLLQTDTRLYLLSGWKLARLGGSGCVCLLACLLLAWLTGKSTHVQSVQRFILSVIFRSALYRYQQTELEFLGGTRFKISLLHTLAWNHLLNWSISFLFFSFLRHRL